MTNDKSRKHLPPYVSYRTFRNFIDGLQQRVPARIDRSYWGDTLSGSTGIQLMAALRFLNLIDDNGKPATRLKPLVIAKGNQREELLKEIALESFSFALQGPLDPQSATYGQLNEFFHETFQLTEDVGRKCIKFFVELAHDAGISLSPFITKRLRSSHTTPGTKTISKKTIHRTKRNLIIPQDIEEIPENISWNRMLLTKFPSFDPNWGDEIKLKWFTAFDELMKHSPSKDGNSKE